MTDRTFKPGSAACAAEQKTVSPSRDGLVRAPVLRAVVWFFVGVMSLPASGLVAMLFIGPPGDIVVIVAVTLFVATIPTTGAAFALRLGPPIAPAGQRLLSGLMFISGSIVSICSIAAATFTVNPGWGLATVCLLSLILAFVLTIGILVLMARGRLRARPAGCCAKCGYPRVGDRSPVCPECGAYVIAVAAE